MKIASRIHPRTGKARVVTIHNRPYAFAPTEDKNGDKHFVAEVNNETHAEVLLGSGDFYAYDETMAPKPTLQPVPPAGKPQEPPAVVLDGIPADVREEALKLLEGSAASISTAVGKVSGLAVVRAAVTLEKAGTNRKTVVALLQSTLDGAAAAGVKA